MSLSLYNLRKERERTKVRRLDRLQDAGINAPREYQRILDRDGDFNANSWLRECYTVLSPFFEGQVVTTVEQIAKHLAHQWAGAVRLCQLDGDDSDWFRLITKAEEFLLYLNLPFPRGQTERTAMARLQDAKWWRRQLNVAIPRIIDQKAREFAQVHKDNDIYLSDAAFQLWEQRQRSNRSTLENLIATNDVGQEYTLAELQDLSTSNPANRRTELMVRCRGLEEWAEEIGYKTALFTTITAPSKYHSHNQAGIRYAHWNFFNPRAVNDYLNRVWARIRADLARQAVEYFGVRVCEPHHDGTPHWHLLIFTGASADQVEASVEKYALAEDGNERGAKKRRVTHERIDRVRGSAVGYIAKYIAKSIDGFGIDRDLYDGEARDSAARVRAWASTWGIRQFQFFGAAPVGPWRELRRVRREVHWPYEEARKAADLAEFKEYINQYLRHGFAPYREPWVDQETGETVSPFNEYGELKEVPIKGIIAHGYGVPLFTRLMNWSVSGASTKKMVMAADGVEFLSGDIAVLGAVAGLHDGGGIYRQGAVLTASEARSGETAEPWTCVSNCTQDFLLYESMGPPG